ncbi:hypothetical protein TNCV_3317681 [Trichonephila clavipes]|nr:hypothetical protein TNCV_3317681 [Trichonephila clavipes]
MVEDVYSLGHEYPSVGRDCESQENIEAGCQAIERSSVCGGCYPFKIYAQGAMKKKETLQGLDYHRHNAVS